MPPGVAPGMMSLAERDLADSFKEESKYPLLIPNNVSQAGWPDRFIQLPNSRIVACEFKVVTLNKRNLFNLAEFRQSQAAWMANWQRYGGLGFLLVGLNVTNKFLGHVVISQTNWKDWLRVNCQRYSLEDVSLMYHMKTVMDWLEDFIKEKELSYA
jgi:hypothetical protein